MNKPAPIIKHKAVLGEGPWWDAEENRLYWIDGLEEGGRGDDLHRYDPARGIDEVWHIGKHIGCAIPTKDGRVLMALEDGIYLFDKESKKLKELGNPELGIKNNRFNDGKCDSKGRLWFGSMSMTANQPGREFEVTGSFYKMERDGKVKKFFGGVGISNGLAWNTNETRMYYIDSTAARVFTFDFDSENGEITNRRTIIKIDDGVPDGMSIDVDGMLWVAHFGGWKLSRWNPESGERIEEIPLPCAQVTSCCFGGADLDELYITTASIGLSEREREDQPLAGMVFMVKPGTRGTILNKF